MDKQKNYYTFKEAMDRLGLRSVNAFRQLERKYPEVFANINPTKRKGNQHWYDKALIVNFARRREQYSKWEDKIYDEQQSGEGKI